MTARWAISPNSRLDENHKPTNHLGNTQKTRVFGWVVCQPKKSKVKLSAKDDDLTCPAKSAAAVGVRPSFESTDQGRHVGGQHPPVGVHKQAL